VDDVRGLELADAITETLQPAAELKISRTEHELLGVTIPSRKHVTWNDAGSVCEGPAAL
jgi:hypothetical protein